MTEMQGYIYNISQIKIISQYLNAQIITQHKTYNVVGLAPEKHQQCMNADKMNSPVKLEQFKYIKGRQEDQLDIQMNKMTRIQLLPKLDFKKKTSSVSVTSTSPSSTRVITKIKDIDLYRSHVNVS